MEQGENQIGGTQEVGTGSQLRENRRKSQRVKGKERQEGGSSRLEGEQAIGTQTASTDSQTRGSRITRQRVSRKKSEQNEQSEKENRAPWVRPCRLGLLRESGPHTRRAVGADKTDFGAARPLRDPG